MMENPFDRWGCATAPFFVSFSRSLLRIHHEHAVVVRIAVPVRRAVRRAVDVHQIALLEHVRSKGAAGRDADLPQIGKVAEGAIADGCAIGRNQNRAHGRAFKGFLLDGREIGGQGVVRFAKDGREGRADEHVLIRHGQRPRAVFFGPCARADLVPEEDESFRRFAGQAQGNRLARTGIERIAVLKACRVSGNTILSIRAMMQMVK